jgi:hypothetical protein
MPGPTTTLKAALLEHASDELLLHVGLVDDDDNELSGGDPAYARIPVTWTAPSLTNEINPTADLLFDIPGGGTVVTGWRCWVAASGGDSLGGKDFSPARTFEGQGTLLLIADEMGWRMT